MLKLFPANHLALTDTLYTVLNNVRAFRSILDRIFSKKLLCKTPIFFIRCLGSRTVYQKQKKKVGVVI
jgi:hypothetical protein